MSRSISHSSTLIRKAARNRLTNIPFLIKYSFAILFGALWLIALPAAAQIPLNNITQVASGGYHACALTSNGGVKCWGLNGGRIGDGTAVDRKVAVDVPSLTSDVTAITAGASYSCALTVGGGVKCWGFNYYGQLGNNGNTTQLSPVDVVGLTEGVLAISAGDIHTCALMSSGGVKCWGNNTYGGLGDGTTVPKSIPVDVVGLDNNIVAISAGNNYTCALTNYGGVKCWGYNGNGNLGDGTTAPSVVAVEVVGLSSGVTKVDAGLNDTCAVLNTGGVKCWGANTYGMLGDGTTNRATTPVDVVGLDAEIVDVVAGQYQTCALTVAGSIRCWGRNNYGQLGNGATVDSLSPVAVSTIEGATALSSYNAFTCALVAANVKCWGGNTYGGLGDNTTINRATPVVSLQALVPIMVGATGGNTYAVVKFNPPLDNGGSPITGYTVTSNPAGGSDVYGGTTDSYTGPNQLGHLITGLVNGTSYTFTVKATNAIGTGIPSAVSNTVIPSAGNSSVNSKASVSSSSVYSSLSSSLISSAIGSSSKVSSSSSSNSSNLSSSSKPSSSSASSANPCTVVSATFGATYSETLSATDCKVGGNYYTDRYTISGIAGQQISALLTSTVFDTYLILKNSSGTTVTSNDNGGGGSNSRIPATSGTFTLPTTGTYTIEVTSYFALKTGTYSLTLTSPGPVSPCAPIVPITPWVSTPGALTTTDCTTGARGSNFYADSFYFIGKSGQQIIVDVFSGSFSSYVFLRGPNGSIVASDTGGGVLSNSRIPAGSGKFTLSESGAYVIEVTSYLPNITNVYSVQLTQ